MKKDVNDLKKMFFEMVKNPTLASNYEDLMQNEPHLVPFSENTNLTTTGKPSYLINHDSHKVEVAHPVEETLNLADSEKEFIIKALKKHRSRRRDAASELGISERTLYRKIKEYDIDE
jgi:transcriptional regulator with PAS, ATPase and Fis domain